MSLKKQLKASEAGVINQRLENGEFVLQVDKNIPNAVNKRIIIPKDPDKLNKFMDTFNYKLQHYTGNKDSLVKFYKCIYAAAYDNGRLITFKPGAEIQEVPQ